MTFDKTAKTQTITKLGRVPADQGPNEFFTGVA
jgi:hypothetical protein